MSNCLTGKNDKTLLVKFTRALLGLFSSEERRKRTNPKNTAPINKEGMFVVSKFSEKPKGIGGI